METEVLAPAGSIEGLKAALYAGADAVYTGGRMFGARVVRMHRLLSSAQ